MKKFILISIAFVFILSSCQKNWDQIAEDNQTNEEEAISMSDMVVSSEFNWKTTKDVEINLSGLNNSEVIFIKSENGDIFNKGIVNSGGNYSTTITVPTYLEDIQLKHAGTEINLEISGNTITFAFS